MLSVFSYLFSCSAVEEPDVVFSAEQIRCGQAETHSPAPENEKSVIICDSDSETEKPATSVHAEDVGVKPNNTAELFLKLKEKPEELLQLAPAAGDIVPLSGKMEWEAALVSYKRIHYWSWHTFLCL